MRCGSLVMEVWLSTMQSQRLTGTDCQSKRLPDTQTDRWANYTDCHAKDCLTDWHTSRLQDTQTARWADCYSGTLPDKQTVRQAGRADDKVPATDRLGSA